MMRLVCLLLFVCRPVATMPEQLSPRMEAHSGETCQVCNQKVGPHDPAYLCGGQRVALHAGPCEEEFLKDPAKYMASLRPDNMIFSTQPGAHLSNAWLWAGIYALLGLVFGGLSAQCAVQKGRPPAGWFALGFAVPIAGFLYLVARSAAPGAPAVPRGLCKVPLTRPPVPCPSCNHPNHPAARRCAGCGGNIQPVAPSEVDAKRGRP